MLQKHNDRLCNNKNKLLTNEMTDWQTDRRINCNQKKSKNATVACHYRAVNKITKTRQENQIHLDEHTTVHQWC